MKWKKHLTILLLLAALSGIFRTTIPAGASCSDEIPIIKKVSFSAADSQAKISFSVYQPACYDERIRGGYPVLYLLHGQNMDQDTWQELSLPEQMRDGMADLSLPGFLIVTVQEDDYLQEIYYSEFDDLILNSIIPWVDANYHTCSNRECRAIGGISRGALWAEKIAFEHSDLFGAVGLHSIPGTIFDDQTLKVLVRDQLEKKPQETLRIYIDTGSEDAYRHDGRAVSDQLNFLGYPHTRVVNPGGHDNDYWRAQIPQYIRWYSEAWDHDSLLN